jgi:hypothetical protein
MKDIKKEQKKVEAVNEVSESAEFDSSEKDSQQ